MFHSPSFKMKVHKTILKLYSSITPAKILYAEKKLIYAASISTQKRLAGEITQEDAKVTCWKHFFKGKMTYVYRNEGQEMAPTIPGPLETLLILKMPAPNAVFRLLFEQVSVGDVVLFKDPLDSDKFLVRRLAALGGHGKESTCDEPFVLDYDQCWVLADNQNLKAEEAKDSQTFGPVPIMEIMGRVIYRFQTMKDHGIVENNSNKMSKWDLAIIRFELELDEMQKFSEAECCEE